MATREIHLPVLHQRQRVILTEARRWNVLCAGRRWGKTQLGIDLAVDPMLDGLPVAWFSLSYKNLSEVWRSITDTLASITTRRLEQEHRIETLTRGSFEAWSWKDINLVRGRKYARVLVDEAAYIDNLIEDFRAAVRPLLADYRGDAWFMSSPNGHNDFETLYEQGQSAAHPAWQSWRCKSEENPFIHPDEFCEMRVDLGPRLAEQEMDALFVDAADVDRFLPSMTLWDACQEVLPPLTIRQPMVLAMDAGDTDDTFAVVGVTRHPDDRTRLAVRYCRVYEPHGTPLDQGVIEGDIIRLWQDFNVVHIAFDKYQLRYLSQRLEQRGIPIEEFSQAGPRLEADKQTLDLVVSRSLAHDGDVVLRQHIANADKKTDAMTKRIRIVKRRQDLKIDACVALSMATARALELNLW
jgi:hypothetical protein